MSKPPVFRTDKTPWDGYDDIFIWVIVGLITAVVAHNISKEMKKREP